MAHPHACPCPRKVGAERTAELCFSTPPSEPDVQVSKHPALQGVTFRAWKNPSSSSWSRSSPSPHRYTTVPRLQTARPNFIGLLRIIGTEDRYSPGPLRHVCGFPALRLLWSLRRSLGSLGDLHPSANEPPTFTQMDSTKSCRWRLSDNPSRALRNPDWKQGKFRSPASSFGLVLGGNQPR
jgi:hypothetical protein